MRLASVRDLKAELLEEMREPLYVKVAKRHLVEMGAEDTNDLFPRASLALGVAPGAGSGPSRFSLAIRLFDQGAKTRRMALRALVLSGGEANLSYVGRLRAPHYIAAGAYRRRQRPLFPGYSVAQ